MKWNLLWKLRHCQAPLLFQMIPELRTRNIRCDSIFEEEQKYLNLVPADGLKPNGGEKRRQKSETKCQCCWSLVEILISQFCVEDLILTTTPKRNTLLSVFTLWKSVVWLKWKWSWICRFKSTCHCHLNLRWIYWIFLRLAWLKNVNKH